MKDVRDKVRMVRAFVGLAMVVFLLLLLTGCWLLNVAPVASFTASTLSGMVPLTVSFSAILSYDSDGIITVFAWDFGDGSSGSGESVSHTFTTEGTRTVVLRVTDDDGARSTAQKTISVLPPEEDGDGGAAGPTASFTATPLTGAAPLSVTFNASASAYAGHAITAYFWDFGDGTTGSGMTTTHTYAPSVTTTYHVVLRIIASDNTEDTATKDITATRTTPAPPSTAPTASFTANPTTALAPAAITYDPAASSAAAGRTLGSLNWSFGDGSFATTYTKTATVSHTYYTAQASQNFTVVLTVIDDLGSTDSYSRTVTVKDWQPVAGFEMGLQTGSYGVADLTVTGLGLAGAAVNVKFQSQTPSSTWATPPLPKAEGTQPGNFVSADKNLSYDPEGQSTAQGWGIVTYLWNFDGATAPTPGTTRPATTEGGCPEFIVTFTLGVGESIHVYDITLIAVDAQGAQSSITRKITLKSS